MFSMYGASHQNQGGVLRSSDIEAYIMQDSYTRYGVPVLSIKKLDETANSLRHACMLTGISYLPLVSTMGVYMFRYFFCPSCGKLYYYKD